MRWERGGGGGEARGGRRIIRTLPEAGEFDPELSIEDAPRSTLMAVLVHAHVQSLESELSVGAHLVLEWPPLFRDDAYDHNVVAHLARVDNIR